MTIRLALGFVVSAAFVGRASRSAPRPVVADAKRAEPAGASSSTLFRLTPEAATRVLGPQPPRAGPDPRLRRRARRHVLPRCEGARPRRRAGRRRDLPRHRRSADGVRRRGRLSPRPRGPDGARRGRGDRRAHAPRVQRRHSPRRRGAWLKLDVKGVWTDEAWVGRSPRPPTWISPRRAPWRRPGPRLLVSAMIPIRHGSSRALRPHRLAARAGRDGGGVYRRRRATDPLRRPGSRAHVLEPRDLGTPGPGGAVDSRPCPSLAPPRRIASSTSAAAPTSSGTSI